MSFALLGAALAICALCGIVVMSKAGASELMEVRLPNGQIAQVVPIQALRQRRMTKLFGPGDLPIPIEDDGLPGGTSGSPPCPLHNRLMYCVFFVLEHSEQGVSLMATQYLAAKVCVWLPVACRITASRIRVEGTSLSLEEIATAADDESSDFLQACF